MKSFFDRLTGGSSQDDEPIGIRLDRYTQDEPMDEPWVEQHEDDELSVDVFQDQDNIYIKAFIPSSEAGSLDLDISRDTVSIRGQKFKGQTVEDENYFQQELRWGSFARKILLPREIDIEASKAVAKDGMLTLTLPKIDKDRRTKLQVKGS